jgi:DNA-binding transcriptional regulator YhcF (GntR family)
LTREARSVQFAIDLESGTPVYLQLKDQIRYAVAVGELGPGDALPSIRSLESSLGINRNTVRRAYLELGDEGTLIIRQGKEAKVAPRAGKPRRAEPPARRAAELARTLVRDVEAKGLDGMRMADAFAAAAAEHDARYPKCVFVECSTEQAADLAAATEAAWRRRVIALDLDRLAADPGALPPSVACVLTTHWHTAEVKRLMEERHALVHDVRLQPSPAFTAGVRRLAGLKVGLLLRDPESIAGYRQLVRRHVAVRGPVQAAVLGDTAKARAIMKASAGLVFTPPARSFVKKHARRGLVTQELLCEPVPEDLARVEEMTFSD